jgi:hypothetical protein
MVGSSRSSRVAMRDDDVRGGLQGLEESVLRLVGEVRRIDDDDAVRPSWVEGDGALNVADLVDGDGRLRFALVVQFECHGLDVGMQAVGDAGAGAATVARGDVGLRAGALSHGMIAVEGLREAEGEGGLADAVGSGEEVGVWWVIARQRAGDGADGAGVPTMFQGMIRAIGDWCAKCALPPAQSAVPVPSRRGVIAANGSLLARNDTCSTPRARCRGA